MNSPITDTYLQYTEMMERMNCTVEVNEPCDVVHIRNHNNQKDFVLSGFAGEGFIAEVRRIWHRIKDLPLDVAFTGHAFKEYKDQII